MSAPTFNPAQAQAVEHQNGPLLVLAGAGSGKTRVITHRIARLVERGVPPHMICALTFTNKAAGEMAERVTKLLPRGAGPRKSKKGDSLVISTFHSFGLMVLGRERKNLGGTFTIFDQGDCLSAVKEILSRATADKRLDAAAILTRISNAKNAFLSPDDFQEREGDEYDEMTKLVYPKYQSALRGFRAYDFDDLVCEVARIWQERPDVLDRWQKEYLYILVDEYQDTNRAQLEVLRLLAGRHRNICVVGDDDQSIYAWRGADVKNILDFEEHFPGAKVVKLEQNYRSAAPILAVANAVIEKRQDSKYKKVLFTEKPGGEKVKVGVAPSPEAEANYVARALKDLIGEGKKAKDLAILYRSNGQAKLLEESLREQGVPYRMIGGQQFFERKEVKDLLAYLKLSLNRSDEISLRRIVNYPPRGIGDTSLERLAVHALGKGWTLWQAIERVDALDDIPSTAREGCKQLEKTIGNVRKRLMVDRRRASEVARELAEEVGLRKDIDGTSPSPNAASRRWSNVEGLFGILTRREGRVDTAGGDATAEKDLMAFLHSLTLQMADEEEDPGNVVTLSTLHGSKGLEFDVVFLIGCEEGLIPHSRTLDARATDATVQDVEEERRLFYVGVTRARLRLELLRCKARVMRGKPMPRTPCRFLSDIPPELVEELEIKDLPTMTVAESEQAANDLLAMLGALGK